jgi:hypothetical protein
MEQRKKADNHDGDVELQISVVADKAFLTMDRWADVFMTQHSRLERMLRIFFFLL